MAGRKRRNSRNRYWRTDPDNVMLNGGGCALSGERKEEVIHN